MAETGNQNQSRKRRVLVIEDEPELAALVVLHLSGPQLDVETVGNGRDGLQRTRTEPWDLIVLDIRLPGLSGREICRELRAQDNLVPILMLTAMGSELDRVLGLEIGADDYLTKPFSVMELQARVKALLRRARLYEAAGQQKRETAKTDELLHAGALKIDRRQHRAWLAGEELSLTRREFDLLWHFASHPDQVFSRDELLSSVWGASHSGFDHTVNSHINRLRGKLRDERDRPVAIETIWGVGYRFACPAG